MNNLTSQRKLLRNVHDTNRTQQAKAIAVRHGQKNRQTRRDRKTEKETWTMVRATEKRRKTNLKLPS